MYTRIISACLLSSLVSTATFAAPTAKPPVSQKVVVKTNLKVKKLNFNDASAKDIAKAIHGIGQKRAERIIEYRQAHGKFKSFEELAKVRGISKRFMTQEVGQFTDKFFISIDNKKHSLKKG